MNWQPIETAPRNKEGEFKGPQILVWYDLWRSVREVAWAFDDCGQGMWFETGIDGATDIEIAPQSQKHITHWMHRPDPPK